MNIRRFKLGPFEYLRVGAVGWARIGRFGLVWVRHQYRLSAHCYPEQ